MAEQRGVNFPPRAVKRTEGPFKEILELPGGMGHVVLGAINDWRVKGSNADGGVGNEGRALSPEEVEDVRVVSARGSAQCDPSSTELHSELFRRAYQQPPSDFDQQAA